MITPGMLAFAIALSGMSIASYTDFIKREVPNKISFGLIIAMLVLRLGYSIQQGDLYYFWASLAIGGLFLGLGMLFFYAQQWGGADVKLLTVLGVGFATVYPDFAPKLAVSWPFFVTILMNFFFIAAAYSLLYAVGLSLTNKNVYYDLRAAVTKNDLIFLGISVFAISALGFFERFFYFFTIVPFFWFLMKFLKSVDKNCMYRIVKAERLVEFDIPQKDIKVGRKVIVNSSDPNGITLSQLEQIKKFVKSRKLQNEFKVRWGIPLIPVFPLTLVASLYFGDIYFALIRLIVMGKLFF